VYFSGYIAKKAIVVSDIVVVGKIQKNLPYDEKLSL
jgi:hypothetical protein